VSRPLRERDERAAPHLDLDQQLSDLGCAASSLPSRRRARRSIQHSLKASLRATRREVGFSRCRLSMPQTPRTTLSSDPD
jgi:hypothetical protein